MLILSRKKNEGVVIGNNITVTIVEVCGDRVRLGIVCPRDASVHRQEVWAALRGLPEERPAEAPPRADPAWLSWNGGTVAKLASVIHEERGWDRLPILADALEEAGCANAAILAHCREAGPHALDCWVVNLLLGKE